MFILTALLFFVSSILSAPSTSSEGIVGVDFGTANVVAGMIGGKVNFQLIQSETGKRKFPAVVTLDAVRRFAGSAAYEKQTRLYGQTFANIINILGKNETARTRLFPIPEPEMYTNSSLRRLAYLYPFHNETILPEEIAAVMLRYVSTMAEKASGIVPDEYVIIIPPAFTQAQRQAVLDAAYIAGIQVRALLESNVASAFWFGTERARTLPYESQHFMRHLHLPELTKTMKEKAALGAGDDESPSFLTKLKNLFLHPIATLFGKKKAPEKKKWSSYTSTDPLTSPTSGAKRLAIGDILDRLPLQHEVHPIIFVDIGDYQTTFTYALFNFTVDEVEVPKNQQTLTPTDPKEIDPTLIETMLVRTGGVLDIRLSHTYEMFGGFRVDEPLLIDSAKELCTRIRHIDQSRGTYVSPSKIPEGAETALKEDDDYILVEDECLGADPTKAYQFPSLQKLNLFKVGNRSDSFDPSYPYITLAEVLLSEDPEAEKAHQNKEQLHKIDCVRTKKETGHYPIIRRPRPVCDEVLNQPGALLRLQRAVRHAKEMLSVSPSQREMIDTPLRKREHDLEEFAFILTQEQLINRSTVVSASLQHMSELFIDAVRKINPSLPATVPVQLMGGTSRIPILQSAVAKGLGMSEDALEKKLNLDEANALGGTIYAHLSRQYFQKPFAASDYVAVNKRGNHTSNVISDSSTQIDTFLSAVQSFAPNTPSFNTLSTAFLTQYHSHTNALLAGRKSSYSSSSEILLPGELEGGSKLKLLRRAPRSIEADVHLQYTKDNATDETILAKYNDGTKAGEVDYELEGMVEIVPKGLPFSSQATLIIPLGNITIIPLASQVSALHSSFTPSTSDPESESQSESISSPDAEFEAALKTLRLRTLPSEVNISIAYSQVRELPTGVPHELFNLSFTNIRREVLKHLRTYYHYPQNVATLFGGEAETSSTEETVTASEEEEVDYASLPLPPTILYETALSLNVMFDRFGILSSYDYTFSFDSTPAMLEYSNNISAIIAAKKEEKRLKEEEERKKKEEDEKKLAEEAAAANATNTTSAEVETENEENANTTTTNATSDNTTAEYTAPETAENATETATNATESAEDAAEKAKKEAKKEEEKKKREEQKKLREEYLERQRQRAAEQKEKRDFDRFVTQTRIIRNTHTAFVSLHRLAKVFVPGQPYEVNTDTQTRAFRRRWAAQEFITAAAQSEDVIANVTKKYPEVAAAFQAIKMNITAALTHAREGTLRDTAVTAVALSLFHLPTLTFTTPPPLVTPAHSPSAVRVHVRLYPASNRPGLPTLSTTLLHTSAKHISDAEAFESEREKVAQLKSSLEEYLFGTKNLLSDAESVSSDFITNIIPEVKKPEEEEEPLLNKSQGPSIDEIISNIVLDLREDLTEPEAIALLTTPEERHTLNERLSDVLDWLEMLTPSEETADIFRERLEDLTALTSPLIQRANETLTRIHALAKAKKWLYNSYTTANTLFSTEDNPSNPNPNITRLITAITSHHKWLSDQSQKQKTQTEKMLKLRQDYLDAHSGAEQEPEEGTTETQNRSEAVNATTTETNKTSTAHPWYKKPVATAEEITAKTKKADSRIKDIVKSIYDARRKKERAKKMKEKEKEAEKEKEKETEKSESATQEEENDDKQTNTESYKNTENAKSDL